MQEHLCSVWKLSHSPSISLFLPLAKFLNYIFPSHTTNELQTSNQRDFWNTANIREGVVRWWNAISVLLIPSIQAFFLLSILIYKKRSMPWNVSKIIHKNEVLNENLFSLLGQSLILSLWSRHGHKYHLLKSVCCGANQYFICNGSWPLHLPADTNIQIHKCTQCQTIQLVVRMHRTAASWSWVTSISTS